MYTCNTIIIKLREISLNREWLISSATKWIKLTPPAPPLHRENPLGWGACEPVPSRSLRPIAGLDVQQRQILYATGRVVHAAAREAHPATHVGHGHRP